ncbi:thioesterase II family protein [[Clostridium] polysaccharolyticum]|uniref:Surfactin synthase thioesterase subunit n=1 Tax=[Clostridium] polysaccharolyticum TaxID=29364 RepID=A0A1I0A8P3_9FIRM|nr:thioesterase domain-containing protein [[Clostridium] polysaccharolyticum]SES90520.1 Surfactin synthase thioesterase subunit [[Clostridium] polysaccharolyticum]
MEKTKLFFLPYAGGSAMGYMTMKRYMDTDLYEPVPLELAGRGSRANEPCYSSIEECLSDLYEKVKVQTANCSYAVFGHSLGAMIGFELLRYIEKKGDSNLLCGIFSGRVAPSVSFPGPVISSLGDKEFLEQFTKLESLPAEMLNNEKILEFIIPVLRADVALSEEYQYYENTPLLADIYVLYGKEDVLIEEEHIDKWKKETLNHCEITSFPGGHFYYKECVETFAKRLDEIMRRYC